MCVISTFCCNRWYRTAAARAQHAQSHLQCTECNFAGIKSILEEHKEVEHGIIPPGGSTRKKSKPDGVIPPNAPKINTPEELAAWIEARKKNWPSQSNVERKEREKAERASRGQLEKTSDSRKRKRRHENGDDDDRSAVAAQGAAAPSTSMDALVNAYAASGSNDEDDDDGSNTSDDSNSVVDPENDAVTSKDPSSMGKIALPQVNKPRPGPRCKFFARGRCKNGDRCRYVHEKPLQEKRQHAPRPVERRPNLLRMVKFGTIVPATDKGDP
ncbi:hypothetical protein BX666DRAFT_426660 [Dichotomocladium elegans]|nr:hypothetical protein BX666DRAFT_426660 [Dichotomocladium elegans]